MLIKKVTVCGFKSYKERTEVSFSSGMNVIVGPNGSGKSNLISAIHFALSEEYGKMKAAYRKTLMYNGEQQREPSYVEIEFDNRDRRLPVDNDIVKFRRIFGLKKDRILVNNNEVPEVRTFLDHAGFTNPYFIVKQGKIAEIAMASDKDRLHLLKEVAGINLYDANQTKSKQLVQQYELINNEINEKLQSIVERIEILRQQREDLTEAGVLDLQKRCIEYVIFERELNDCKSKIEHFEDKIFECRSEWSLSVQDLQKEYKEKELKLMKTSAKLAEHESGLLKYQLLKERVDSRMAPSIEKEQQAKQQLEDLTQQLESGTTENEYIDNKLQHLRQEQQKKKEALTEVSIEVDGLMEQEQMTKEECVRKQTELKTFRDKLTRFSELQFSSKEDRDRAIQTEIKQGNKDSKKNTRAIIEAESKISSLEEEKNKLENDFTTSMNEYQWAQNNLSEFSTQLEQLQNELHAQNVARDENWNNLNNESDKFQLEAQKEEKLREKLQRAAGHKFLLGIEGVAKIVSEFQAQSPEHPVAQGYYGTVLDNIDCSEEYCTAIEAAGGALLMYHIVSTHEVSLNIMRIFNREKLRGEVNFIALDKIKMPENMGLFQNTASQDSSITRMVDKMQATNEAVVPAIKFVFGKSLLCRTSEIAATAAKEHKKTCVTIDGDKFQSSGVLTGGYINPAMSKIRLYKQWMKVHEKMEHLNESIEKFREKDNEIQSDNIPKKIERCTVQKARIENTIEVTLKLKELTKVRIDCNSNRLKETKKYLNELQVLQVQLQAQDDYLKRELSQPMGPPNDEDRRKIQDLKSEVQLATKKASILCKKRIKEEGKRDTLRMIIGKNEKLIEELSHEKSLFRPEIIRNKITSLQTEIKGLEEQIEHQRKVQLKILEKKIPEQKENIRKSQEVELTLLDEQRQLATRIAAGHPEIIRLDTDLKRWQETYHECELKIKNSTGVPSGVQKYQSETNKCLSKRLEQVCKKLEKYKNVSRAVLDQYSQLNDKLTEIQEKKEQLDVAKQRVLEITSTVEADKQKRLFMYFGMLQKNFETVFKSLVPLGRAQLVLYGSDFEIRQINEDEELTEEGLIGVKLRVTFMDSPEIEISSIDQLSGGQKSLVSLALIMAIQKLDPVPVYLFDEVDHALDPEHREAVARLIVKSSSEAQFLCTTFREEFVQKARSFHGVGFGNISSIVQKVTRDQALKFIREPGSASGSSTSFTTSSDDCDTSGPIRC